MEEGREAWICVAEGRYEGEEERSVGWVARGGGDERERMGELTNEPILPSWETRMRILSW